MSTGALIHVLGCGAQVRALYGVLDGVVEVLEVRSVRDGVEWELSLGELTCLEREIQERERRLASLREEAEAQERRCGEP